MRLTFIEGHDESNNHRCYCWEQEVAPKKDTEGNALYPSLESVKEKRPESTIWILELKEYITGGDRIAIDAMSLDVNENGDTVRNVAAWNNATVSAYVASWNREGTSFTMEALKALPLPVYLCVLENTLIAINKKTPSGDYL